MILFIINKEKQKPDNGRYMIPVKYDLPDITEGNAGLIAWNEVQWEDSSREVRKIYTVSDLKQAVFEVAKKDCVSVDICAQFWNQYGIDIFVDYLDEASVCGQIINRIFQFWPHPMIGNILLSPGTRPLDSNTQYISNWKSFPEKYMSDVTKAAIKGMNDHPEDVGLKELRESGRDQVRICKDLTELTRAVMGEISTYATKKLEKIFALELCRSQKLIAAQRQLIRDFLEIHEDILLESYASSKTEYISKYFPEQLKFNEQEQKDALRMLIDCALGETVDIAKYTSFGQKYRKLVIRNLELFQRLPEPIRCAILLAEIRRSVSKKENERAKPVAARRYALAAVTEITEDSPFWIDCEIKEASGHGFIPALTKEDRSSLFLWNRTRDENHETTITYRHFLLPLWGGPSGHATEIIDFYTQKLYGHMITVGDEIVPISAVILGSMFPLWRLYYDKRISAVHTLAETFDSALTSLSFPQKELSALDVGFINAHIHYETAQMRCHEPEEYDDPFDVLLFYPPAIPNTYGIVHPARVMAQIRKKHDTADLAELGERVDSEKAILWNAGFAVPEWSKPIAESSSQKKKTAALKGSILSSFNRMHVRTFAPPKKQALHCFCAPSARLEALYEKLSQATEYHFSEDFADLPACVIGSEIKPMLSELTFSEIQDCKMDGGQLSFNGTVETDSVLSSDGKAFLQLQSPKPIHCVVADDEQGFDFIGSIDAAVEWRITDKLTISIQQLHIRSGLDRNSSFPQMYVSGEIRTGADTLALNAGIPQGKQPILVSGVYEGGKVLTLGKLLSLFGLEEVVDVSSLLPAEEGVFGALGLRDFSMTVLPENGGISHIGFTITAEKPWRIFDGKILLQPYFEIEIEQPFQEKARRIDYTVLGKWTIGGGVFDLVYRSDQMIQAQLAAGSVLNFEEVAQLFAKDVRFPAVKLTGMALTADLTSKNYFLALSAEDLWKFPVGNAELGIQDVAFQLDFRDGAFGDLTILGTLALGGLSLHLTGSYYDDGTWSFETEACLGGDFSLGDFIEALTAELCGSYDPAAFPEEFLTANIRLLSASYQSEGQVLTASISLDHVLQISEDFSIDAFSLEVLCAQDRPISFELQAQVSVCKADLFLKLSRENGEFVISGEADFQSCTFGDAAAALGLKTEALPGFLETLKIPKLGLTYNFTRKALTVTAETNAASLTVFSGRDAQWRVTYQAGPALNVNLFHMPLVGELVSKALPQTGDFSIGEFSLEASSEAEAVFRCMAFGSPFQLSLTKPDQALRSDQDSPRAASLPAVIKWVKLNKTISVLSIPKLGIGLDGSRMAVLLDASLNVTPFSFTLADAGIGIDLLGSTEPAFYLSGFGVSFQNNLLSIGGSFSRTREGEKTVYAGSLLIRCKAFTAAAVGEYASGALLACCNLTFGMEGPPAFTVTGLALGFGYNKALTLPSIEQVPQFPLITAIHGGFQGQTLTDLNEWIKDENGQSFFTAGVQFRSFNMVNGCVLLSVAFGSNLEISALGTAELSVPANTKAAPLAKAQLALKAAYTPSEAVFRAEARLTSESYLLSHDCKLTGGFAAYCWFDGSEHSGDFVITLGGYHPAFQRPEHYPVVPRLGFDWNVDPNLNLSGEMYFALTPSTVMVGGRLSAVYTQGHLKAWFIAYADFLISWSPFAYSADIGVSLGASYRVDKWFIHKTFSIELSAKLALWGPEVQGRLHVSWFILSFTISFSKGPDHSADALDWAGFKQRFLTQGRNDLPGDSGILTLRVEGITGKTPDGVDVVTPKGLTVTLSSKIPESGNVRPVNNAALKTQMELKIEAADRRDVTDRFTISSVTKNLPAAMWKTAPDNVLREESVIRDAVCGLSLRLKEATVPELFPRSGSISLEALYQNNTLCFPECFQLFPGTGLALSDADSIRQFSRNGDSAETRRRRQEFLAENGITEEVSISAFAEDAEDWLSENILIKRN